VTTDEIRAIPLFESVSRRRRKSVARLFDRITLPAGRAITVEGESAREFFVIIDGNADVLRDGRSIAALGAGDFFGEIGLVGERRTATVIATSDLDVAVITRRDFHQLIAECPEVASTVLSTGSKRTVALLRHVAAARNEKRAAPPGDDAVKAVPLLGS
jgi:CRP-like cAMP-binding protein